MVIFLEFPEKLESPVNTATQSIIDLNFHKYNLNILTVAKFYCKDYHFFNILFFYYFLGIF